MAAAAAATENSIYPIFENIRKNMLNITLPYKQQYLIVDKENLTLWELRSLFEIVDNYKINEIGLNTGLNKNFSVYSILKSALKYFNFNEDINVALQSIEYAPTTMSLEINQANFVFKSGDTIVFSINRNILFDEIILKKLLHFVMFINPDDPKHKIIIDNLQHLGVDYILQNLSVLNVKDPKLFRGVIPPKGQQNGGYRSKHRNNKKSLNKNKQRLKARKTRKTRKQ